ncbi:16S rRNA (uracil(1498)-N(3))-methyltransferase [Pontiella sulfatireligans]|uniref:Ribosomal RNA small subunit methyltransferase E n=1 Tax=Pontiella sulfatireligans TaxID=2750658 RepID=A0A6C2UM07_9BACT|nr:16S rRNA (uracil(1498)-N(3))-methyltransferase [Pontiella sulfatireligans]VGO20146.1 Ribosomal RNA small subunit methyltransferase E [Pontiella sulfatireligans]
MNLILLQPSDFVDDRMAELFDERAQHIRKVLKAEPGKRLRIGLLNGPLGVGTVLAVDKHGVCINCAMEEKDPPQPRIDLLLAMPRPKVLKRLWAQLAALGVGRIVLVNADKVERCYFDSHVIDPDFYNKLLIEGLQQARCTHLPEVLIRPRFKPFIEDEFDGLFTEHVKLLADPSGEKRMDGFDFDAHRVLLAIGPEGGWTAYELEKLQAHGFQLFGMGKRILRTDTACIALVAEANQLAADSVTPAQV